MKPIQKIDDIYIGKSRLLSVTERIEFIEEYRLLLPESVFIEKQRQYLKDWESIPGT